MTMIRLPISRSGLRAAISDLRQVRRCAAAKADNPGRAGEPRMRAVQDRRDEGTRRDQISAALRDALRQGAANSAFCRRLRLQNLRSVRLAARDPSAVQTGELTHQ